MKWSLGCIAELGCVACASTVQIARSLRSAVRIGGAAVSPSALTWVSLVYSGIAASMLGCA